MRSQAIVHCLVVMVAGCSPGSGGSARPGQGVLGVDLEEAIGGSFSEACGWLAERAVDFGSVPIAPQGGGDLHHQAFDLRNPHPVTHHVIAISGSCDCSQVYVDVRGVMIEDVAGGTPIPVPPGERLTVHVTRTAPRTVGEEVGSVTVFTSDLVCPQITVRTSITGHAAYSVEPSVLDLGRISRGDAVSGSWKVRRSDGQPMSLRMRDSGGAMALPVEFVPLPGDASQWTVNLLGTIPQLIDGIDYVQRVTLFDDIGGQSIDLRLEAKVSSSAAVHMSPDALVVLGVVAPGQDAPARDVMISGDRLAAIGDVTFPDAGPGRWSHHVSSLGEGSFRLTIRVGGILEPGRHDATCRVGLIMDDGSRAFEDLEVLVEVR